MKRTLASKTIWFAILTVVLGVAASFGFGDFVPSPELQTLLNAVILIVVGIVNFILRRYFTSEAIG